MSNALAGNIWKLTLDRFIASFWVAIPLLVPYYETKGLAASQVFLIQAIFSLAVGILEVPTGYLADAFGRRRTLIVSAFILPLGVACYLVAEGFWGFVAAEVVIALALSLRSGADSAMLYDTLLGLKREGEHKKFEGYGFLAERSGIGISAILGGLLAAISLTTPFVVNVAAMMALLPLALTMKEPPREKDDQTSFKEHIAAMHAALLYFLRQPSLRAAGAFSAVLMGVAMVGHWSNFLYYKQLGIDVRFYGFLSALTGLAGGWGGQAAHRLEKQIGPQAALCLPLGMGVGFAALALMTSLYALPFAALSGFLWGVSIPLLRDIVHRQTPSAIRATVLSVISMAGRLFYFLLALLCGWIVDNGGLASGYALLAGVALVLGGAALWGLLASKPFKQPAALSSL